MKDAGLWVKTTKTHQMHIEDGKYAVVLPRTICMVLEQGHYWDYIWVIPDVFVFEGAAWENECSPPFKFEVRASDVYVITHKEASENHPE